MNAFPLRLETRLRCPLSLFLFNIIPEVPASEVGQEKEIKGFSFLIRIEKVKLSLFTEDMFVNVENPLESTKELLELISAFSKVAGYNANI